MGSSAPEAAPTSSSAAADGPAPGSSALGNRKVSFHIKTGGNKWTCTLQDRGHYERVKAANAPKPVVSAD